jgi:hypothetical protein
MRGLAMLLSGLLALPLAPGAMAQDTGARLNLVIVEGDGAINNIRQRTAREPIVQVEDENHKPVAGAAVTFALPAHGAGGTFATGGHTLTVVTDDQGRAVAQGLRPNTVKGQYQIQVTASHNGLAASATITQTNVVAAAAAGAVAAGISAKLIAVLVIAAAAGAGGAIYATHSGGGSGNSTTPAAPALVTISAATGSVGAPPR